MTRRTAVAVAAVAALLVAAALSLYIVRPSTTALPSTTPTATASSATGAPTANVTPGATASPAVTPSAATSPSAGQAPVADDRYGYVFAGQEGRIAVRRERDFVPMSMQGATSPTPGPAVFELSGVSPAVSADGKRLAYWRTTSDATPNDLRVLDVADPRSDRSVLTLAGRRGGGLAWSSDGQGLLVATCGLQGVGPFGAPSECDLEMLDLTTSPATTRKAAERLGGGRVFLPVAWDRAAQVAAAAVTGEGGYLTEYVTWRGRAPSPFTSVEMPRPLLIAGWVRASADAKLVLAVEDSLSGLRVWPLEDVTKAETVTHTARITHAFWRPGATAPYEVIWGVGNRVELVAYVPGRLRVDSPTVLYTGTGSVGVSGIRADGSAVLVGDSTGAAPPPSTRVFLVRPAMGQATELATTVGSVHALSHGVYLR